MKDILIIVLQVCGALGGILATGWGIYMGYKKVIGADEKRLDRARQNLSEVLEANCAAWKEKFEIEHRDFNAYRDETHNKLNLANAKILSLTEETTILKSRTDVTPILDLQRQTNETMTKVAQLQQSTVELIHSIAETLNITKP